MVHDPNSRPPGYLPPEIAAQPFLAQRAFTLLLAKPGRSLSSIARELGTSASTLSRLSRAARWETHLASLMATSPESLVASARLEAHRSRAEMLASNRLAQGAVDAALAELVEVDEHGNVRLRPGKDVSDVQKLALARQTHVKTTQMLTGEDAAIRRHSAAAGAPKIIINTRDMVPEPVPVSGHLIEYSASNGH